MCAGASLGALTGHLGTVYDVAYAKERGFLITGGTKKSTWGKTVGDLMGSWRDAYTGADKILRIWKMANTFTEHSLSESFLSH